MWQQIGTPVSIIVDDWTAQTTNFHFTVNFNNSGVGLSNGTKMKIVLTEENASGLGTPDTFELPVIFSSTQPSITVTSPNGGERWERGKPYNITWDAKNVTEDVIVSIRNNGISTGSRVTFVTTAIPATAKTVSFTVPMDFTLGDSYDVRVGVGDSAPEDRSNSYFSVVAPTVRRSPRARAGLSMLDASIAPSAPPAPTIATSDRMVSIALPRQIFCARQHALLI